MTELEKHLINGFEKLAKQYEAEQQRQQEQISNLSGQVMQLSQRVEQLTKLHSANELLLRQDFGRAFSSLSGQLKELSES